MGATAKPEPRFSIRLIHLNSGWRYMVLDRARQSEFLGESDGAALDFGTESEARAAIGARFGSSEAGSAVLRGKAA